MGKGPTNGVELLLDDRKTIKLREQEQISIDCMREHREELRSLATFPGVEALNLGLVYRITPNMTGCCLGPSPALMFHALDSGIDPNYFVTILRQEGEAWGSRAAPGVSSAM